MSLPTLYDCWHDASNAIAAVSDDWAMFPVTSFDAKFHHYNGAADYNVTLYLTVYLAYVPVDREIPSGWRFVGHDHAKGRVYVKTVFLSVFISS